MLFDALSKKYDRINRILSFGMDHIWRQKAAKHLPKQKNLHLLDIASGTGEQLIACFESGASIASAKGIDLSSKMLSIASEKIAKKSYCKKISLICADAKQLPFKNAFFDAATCSFGIRNIAIAYLSQTSKDVQSNLRAALQELRRVLKPKGKLILLEFSFPSHPCQWLHRVYLRRLMPKIGAFLSKNPPAYLHLSQTIERFPKGKHFCSLIEQEGFSHVTMTPLISKTAAIYLGDAL